jgi:hypothetical protein
MDEDVRFTAQMNIDYYAARRGITVEEIGVAPCVVLSWGPTAIEELAESIGAEPAEHWHWLTRYPLVVSDVVWQEWKPAFRTPELKAATRRAQRVVLRALEAATYLIPDP